MYKLRRPRHEKRRKALRKRLVAVAALVGLTLIVWQVWIGLAQMMPTQTRVKSKTDERCIATGNASRGSQPEVCPDKGNRR